MPENLPTPSPAVSLPMAPPDGAASAPPAAPAKDNLLTQEQVDAIVKRRLSAAQKQWEADAAEKAKQATMSETERLNAELEAAKKATADTLTAAQQRIAQSEAKMTLLAEGANPERLEFLTRAMDLSAIEFDGEDPDLKALGAAVATVKKDLPELFGIPASTQRSGGDFGQGKESKRVYAQSEYAELCKDEAYFAEHREELLAASHEGRIIFGK